jgi:hypothetical protein
LDLRPLSNSEPDRNKPRRFFAVAGSIVWLVVLSSSLFALSAFGRLAGHSGVPSVSFQSQLFRSGEKQILIVAVHPRCPCTRATVSELAKIIAHAKNNIDLKALVYIPSDATREWTDTSSIGRLRELGFAIILDPKGKIAEQLGAETSGHVLLYRQNGELALSGGITAGRGHEGDNPAKDRLLRALEAAEHSPTIFTAIYGCSLDNCRRTVN